MHNIPTRTLDEVFAVCRFTEGFPGPWWLGGGWAIDIWTGGPSREHEDIEICVPRSYQEAVHAYCADWRFFTPVNEQWAALPEGEMLESPRFMLQLRRTPESSVSVEGMPSEFEFLLNDVADGEWIFLPEPSIRLPMERVYGPSPLGLPVTAPEILLLHKAQHHRPKDEHDFERVRDRMDVDRRAWLRLQLERIRPEDPWIAELR